MASVAQTAVATSTTDTATPTFAAQSVGANGGSDIIYIAAGGRTTADASTLSVTVDGVAATQIVFLSNNEGGGIRANCGIYAVARNSLPDPAQTDVDVALTHNQVCIRHGVAVAVSADASATAHATASAAAGSTNLNLNTPASGIVMGAAYNGDIASFGWTGLTEQSDLDVASEGSNRFTTAYASAVSAETPRTVTAATATDLAAKVAASFPVAAAAAARPVVGRDLINSRFIAPRALVN